MAKKSKKATLQDCSKCKESFKYEGKLLCNLKLQDESRLQDNNYSCSIVSKCECIWFVSNEN